VIDTANPCYGEVRLGQIVDVGDAITDVSVLVIVLSYFRHDVCYWYR